MKQFTMARSRKAVNAAIGTTKRKLSWRKRMLSFYTKRKNKVAIAKWKRLVGEAEYDLNKLRAELKVYQDADKVINKMSQKGREFLAGLEGIVLQPYNDTDNNATIGIGHLIHHGPVTAYDRAKYKNFTKKDALDLFAKDLLKYEMAVNAVWKNAKLNITQERYDACVSLCFNVGTGGFESSTVARKIKQGLASEAGNAFLMWNKPKEIIGRRHKERNLFMFGKYQ